jgi:ATP-binding protein involved in chromosome partitioning
MLFKAMDQFFRDVLWEDLDYLLIDLPPGTGDVALTVAQKVPVNGAIVVCTPQNLALIDARKAVDMFDRMSIPVYGLVENMSYLKSPSTGERIQLFPKGELDAFIDSKKIPKLGEIPFCPSIGLSCEAGIPYVMTESSSDEAKIFMDIAKKLEAISV